MKHLKLLNNKVLIKPKEISTTTASGFILPESAQGEEKIRAGIVVAVGTGARGEDGTKIPLEVAVDDEIMFEYSSYSTKEIEMERETYYLISEHDIIGIINR
jgi:chaperonin GroES